MKIFKKVLMVVLSILLLGGPQLNSVDAIEISNDLNSNMLQKNAL